MLNYKDIYNLADSKPALEQEEEEEKLEAGSRVRKDTWTGKRPDRTSEALRPRATGLHIPRS